MATLGQEREANVHYFHCLITETARSPKLGILFYHLYHRTLFLNSDDSILWTFEESSCFLFFNYFLTLQTPSSQSCWRKKQNRLYLESGTPSWAGLWTLSYMPSIYGNNIPTRKVAPWKKSPRPLHHLKEYSNYLCNRTESCILLCLLRYDHRPVDNCPLLTT